jgi:hypothetical protein
VAERGRRDHAAANLVLSLERNQRRPHGYPAREVLRPVDRVDDPPDRTAAAVASFLTNDVLVRTGGGNALT